MPIGVQRPLENRLGQNRLGAIQTGANIVSDVVAQRQQNRLMDLKQQELEQAKATAKRDLYANTLNKAIEYYDKGIDKDIIAKFWQRQTGEPMDFNLAYDRDMDQVEIELPSGPTLKGSLAGVVGAAGDFGALGDRLTDQDMANIMSIHRLKAVELPEKEEEGLSWEAKERIKQANRIKLAKFKGRLAKKGKDKAMTLKDLNSTIKGLTLAKQRLEAQKGLDDPAIIALLGDDYAAALQGADPEDAIKELNDQLAHYTKKRDTHKEWEPAKRRLIYDPEQGFTEQ